MTDRSVIIQEISIEGNNNGNAETPRTLRDAEDGYWETRFAFPSFLFL